MKLSDLLTGLIQIEPEKVNWIESLEVGGVSLDSREVKAGDLFIALSGASSHGLQHVNQAIENGAVAVLFDPAKGGDDLAKKIQQIPMLAINNLGIFLGELAARFYGKPSEHLNVIGVTGTNGKTSCSQFLGQMLDDCGIIGTLGWGEWGHLHKTANTTPDALFVQKVLRQFINEKKTAVAMEVSSHGLDQNRVNGVKFKGTVFTNLSRDHLDYHQTMDDYLAAKLKLMAKTDLDFAVVNLDDAYSERIIASVSKSVRLWCVSTKGKILQSMGCESLLAENIEHNLKGFEFQVRWQGQSELIQVPLYGDFNVENILCVLAVMLASGMTLAESALRLKNVQAVAGRMESCGIEGRGKALPVFIDYAHTPDALGRVLSSLRPHCKGLLWVVFGCGGNRDAGKRPLMGKIANQWADHVVITDDNPRFENNVTIAKEILIGCKTDKTILIQDRKQAIEHAINNAKVDDCVVVAGKGHEDYQEISGIRYPFSDKLIVQSALNKRFAA